MTRTDPRTENKTARELMRENVQHALRDFLATYGEKESEIMSAFDTALEAIAVEVENQTPDEFSGYGEIERRIVKGTLELPTLFADTRAYDPQTTHIERYKAAKFTKTERALINDTLEALMEHEPRNIVLMGLASHLIGVVVFCSKGTLSKELVSDLVLKGVEV